MRTPVIVGNWKMNLLSADATERIAKLGELSANVSGVEFGICAPFLSIPNAVEASKGTQVGVGAQDMFWKESGAFTGFVSAAMLVDAGVKYVIIGHSERRGKFGKLEVDESALGFFAETDETVNLKTKAALAHGLIPIVCCGETLAEREAGQTDAVITEQISKGLAGVDGLEKVVIAYEPVWAIGTGKVCDSAEANRVCAFIRSLLPAEAQSAVRIQYGGSMNPANASELLGQSDIDGGLVGGASLKPEDFIQIINAAQPA